MIDIKADIELEIAQCHFVNNLVITTNKISMPEGHLIRIMGNVGFALIQKNVFSCNGVEYDEGHLSYPKPIYLAYQLDSITTVEGNTILGCPILDVLGSSFFIHFTIPF